jgi:hypothetical protein
LAEVVHADLCHAFLLKPFFVNGLKNAFRFSDQGGAEAPGIPAEPPLWADHPTAQTASWLRWGSARRPCGLSRLG